VRAVVTGGAGFIGSNLVDALVARGDEVVVVDDLSTGRRAQIPAAAQLVERDVREPLVDLFRAHRPDVCFHLAAKVDVTQSVENPLLDASTNVLGTVSALAAAAETGAKVVFASSGGAVYGEAPTPVTEDEPATPLSPYGTGKLVGELYVDVFGRMSGVGHVALRFANVYGPRQFPGTEAAVVGVFVTRLAAGEQPRIFGDGLQTRDFVFVGDAVEALLSAAERGAGVYNVGTGRSTTVLDLYEQCCRAAGVDPAPVFADWRPGEIHDNVVDPTRARRELAWEPRTPLEDGVERTWAWARDVVSLT
jgi:UDP-glucose 4-epimerase